jgi:acyl-CoA hydrolase/GNAT superfamily N-acetyltransferase
VKALDFPEANMISRQPRYAAKILSVDQAVRKVKNGDRVFLGSLCTEPKPFVKSLGSSSVEDVELVQFIPGSAAAELAQIPGNRFTLKTFFMGRRAREGVSFSEANYLPLYHSEIPKFFRNRRIPVDVAVVQVSEPDRFGRFSLGISVDISLAAVESARIVIVQVNSRMPRTHGDTFIHADNIDFLIDETEELEEIAEETISESELAITRYCSELIEDGSVLHFGFAGISRGLMDCFTDHKNLGIHTEIFTDPLIDLIESGIVNNSTKKMFRGKSLASGCMGTRRLYEWVNDNSMVEFYPTDVLLNPSFIASNEKMVAINLALQVDLRGQIRQGSPTWTAFEGSGGDHDFMRGANLSKNGRSIVCLRSTSLKHGNSTIVSSFSDNAAVMMNRGDVNFVVTEYGTAYLGGRSVRERAMALIEISHPDHREDLMREARELGYIYSGQVYYRSVSPEFRKRVRINHVFKNGFEGHVRAIKPTDESMIRDLFYHMSESSVYFRYFAPRKSMPHANLRQYVNVADEDGLSLVVTTGAREDRHIVAEARYMLEPSGKAADAAFMVAEEYHGLGIATFLINYLMELAKERGVEAFEADVLPSNRPMLTVFEKTPYVLHKKVDEGVITLRLNFNEPKANEQVSE